MSVRVASFVRERNEALFSLDRERIEAYFRKQGAEMPKACLFRRNGRRNSCDL